MDVNELRRNAGNTEAAKHHNFGLGYNYYKKKTYKYMYKILGLILSKKWGCLHI